MARLALGSGASLPGTYDPQLVVLSVVIASIAAYAALTLAERVTVATGRLRLLWLLGGATAMGSGIWSMHFTGMLAFALPLPITYDVPLVARLPPGGDRRLGHRPLHREPAQSAAALWLLGGLTLGAGVGAMHYIGMAAMRMDAMARWDLRVVALSVLIAVVVSLVALWLSSISAPSRHGAASGAASPPPGSWAWPSPACTTPAWPPRASPTWPCRFQGAWCERRGAGRRGHHPRSPCWSWASRSAWPSSIAASPRRSRRSPRASTTSAWSSPTRR